MAYKTGLRLLAALFGITGVGIPIALVLWWVARREEKKIEQHRANMETVANTD